MTCCKRPQIANMDYDYWDYDAKVRTRKVNRCCLNCGAHWTGTPDNIRQFTSKEWDTEMAGALKI